MGTDVTKIQQTLESALRSGSVLRFSRCAFDGESVFSSGYVVELSDSWMVTHYIGDQLHLDGYDAVRVRDLSEVSMGSSGECFLEKCMALKGQKPKRPIGIDPATTRSLLESISRNYPVVMIHREEVSPNECELGQLKLVGEDSYALRWMTPLGEWADDEDVYRFDDVTRVTFASEYDTTLAAIAGLLEWSGNLSR